MINKSRCKLKRILMGTVGSLIMKIRKGMSEMMTDIVGSMIDTNRRNTAGENLIAGRATEDMREDATEGKTVAERRTGEVAMKAEVGSMRDVRKVTEEAVTVDIVAQEDARSTIEVEAAAPKKESEVALVIDIVDAEVNRSSKRNPRESASFARKKELNLLVHHPLHLYLSLRCLHHFPSL